MVVQAPFIYSHMLASLVIVNNILNCVAFGMLLGVTVGVIVQANPPKGMGDEFEDKARPNQAARDIQNLVVGFFFMVVGPCLYQALLQVAILIAQPFNNEDAMIPTMRLLDDLERDLRDGWRFSETPPSWDKPTYH